MIESLCCLAVFSIGWHAPLTFACGATRLPLILDRLSKESGETLHCSPAFENEVLYISVRNETLEQLTGQIAKVTHAEWSSTSGTYTLNRTRAEQVADQKADQSLTADVLRSRLYDEIHRPLAPMGPSEEEKYLAELSKAVSKVRMITQFTPELLRFAQRTKQASVAGRACDRLLGAMDLSTLAKMPPWQARLYTANPNRFQMDLGEKAMNTVRAFEQEEGYVLRMVAGMSADEVVRARDRYGLSSWYTRPLADPVTVFLHEYGSSTDKLSLEAQFLDRLGYEIDGMYIGIDLWPEADTKELPGFDSWAGDKLGCLEDARLMAQAVNSQGTQPARIAGSDRPLARDPLGLILDRPLRQLEEATDKGIVAALPDEAASPLASSPMAMNTLGDFCRRLGRYVSFEPDSGVILMTPRKRQEAYDVRAKRAPLQTLLTSARPITLDAVCSYVLAQSDAAASTEIESMVLDFNQCGWPNFHNLEIIGDTGGSDRQKLKFYALLTPAQRKQAATDGLTYARLSPEQQGAVFSWLYLHLATVSVARSTRPGSPGAELPAILAGPEEPSVTLPDGIPPDALFRLVPSRKASILASSPSGRALMAEPDFLGYAIAGQEEPASEYSYYPKIVDCKMTPGYLVTLEFHVTYMPGVSQDFELQDYELLKTEPVAWGDLPPEWLKPMTTAIAQERQQRANRGSEPAKVPPPRG